MHRVTLYSTDPCPFCRHAKSLLSQREIPFNEVNLSKDAAGRAELVEKTGMMTFPQILIDGQPLGGFRELAQADAQGRLSELSEAAAA